MPFKRDDSPIWYANYTDASGRRVRCSTDTTNRKEAEEIEAKWKLEARQQRLWGTQPSRTFDELMIAYLKATQDVKRSPERDLFNVKRLKPFFSGRELHTLKRPDVRGYIAQRKAEEASNATINREVGLLSAAINYARREWDWEISNPAERMRLREAEGRTRFATVEQVENLIRVAMKHKRSSYLADLIRVAVNTGCRRGELLGLRWTQVDLSFKTIRLGANDTKSGKGRLVHLNQQALAAILSRITYREMKYPDSEWVFCGKRGMRILTLGAAWDAVRKEAGMHDFHFHDLRHTCASLLAQNGVPLADIKEVLGHSTIRMTERYAHLAPENVRAALEKLNRLSQTYTQFESSENVETVNI